jgi:hypothetical protein
MASTIPTSRHLSAFRKEIRSLLISLKPTIYDDYRAHPEATLPSIAVTIGAKITPDGIAWNYQTGDNSYTGGAYGFPDWGICDLYRRDNCTTLASDIVEQFLDLWAQSRP